MSVRAHRRSRAGIPLALIACVVGAVAVDPAPAGAAALAPPSAAAQPLPADNLVPNGSFESGLAPFAADSAAAASAMADAPAPNGSHVVKVVARAGGDYGIGDAPGPVVRTAPETAYRASVRVAAAASETVGKAISLTVREHNAAGTTIDEWTSPDAGLTADFETLTVTATPTSGNWLDLYVTGWASAAGDAFYADSVSMVTTVAPPAGFTVNQLRVADRFGTKSGYSLLDHWNFGMTDNNTTGGRAYRPWNPSGTSPYWGSGVAPAAGPTDEYWDPTQISQTSSGAGFQGFTSTGTGVSITAKPRTYNYPMAGGKSYQYGWTSGSINTYGKVAFGGNGEHVFVQVKAKMPSADGAWGSIWMFPAPGNTADNSHEIDMMQSGYLKRGVDPHRVIRSGVKTSVATVLDAGSDLSAGYHVYGVDLNSATGRVTFYLDGKLYGSYADAPTGPMFLALSLQIASAASSAFHTVPPLGTTASTSMSVAEVQVYSKLN